MAAATKKQPAAAASTGEPAAVVDPKFECAEKAGSFVLRLPLPGFRKDDFRVQVDGAGRLTVRGTRPAAAGPGSLHKVFQLPSAASLDDIAGRFEAGVLTLTVPKRGSSAGAGANAGVAAAPTTIEEIKRKQQADVSKEEDATGGEKKGDAGMKKTEAKEELARQEDVMKKPVDEATSKAQEKKQEEVEEAKSRKQEQQKQSPAPMKQEEEVKPKAPPAAAASPPQEPTPEPEAATGTDKAKAAVAPEDLAERVRQRGEEEHAMKPEAATGGEKAKTAIVPDSLAERVRRRGEEEQRAKAAEEAKAEQEKKAMAVWGGWKERVQGELKVLTDMKWADGLVEAARKNTVVEAARKNKEVVAVAVAAFSLGFLVSHKLCRK